MATEEYGGNSHKMKDEQKSVKKGQCFSYHVWWFEYAWPMGSGTIRRCGLVGRSAIV